MKLNLGSNNKRRDGYKNVDVHQWGDVDIIHDLTEVPYPFDNDSIEAILMEEVFEHISFRKVGLVLQQCHRILEPRGLIEIQVPDIGKMCQMYARGEVCDCVPHKTKSWNDYHADPYCPICKGKAKINTNRFWISFSGTGKHPWDWHHGHYDRYRLGQVLAKAGFGEITYTDNIYKVKVRARKV